MSRSLNAIFDRLGTAEAPPDPPVFFDHAVVMGGSIAGLLAARVLADHAETVLIIERDELTDAPVARPGVPQASQVHMLLGAGRVQLDCWFDGFSKEAVADGAVLAGGDAHQLHFNGRRKVTVPDVELLCSSRPFLESVVRRRITRLPNVSFVRGRATGVEFAFGQAVGVRYEPADGGRPMIESADFIVDAMGRSSRLGDWLERSGWQKAPTRRMKIGINYTCACFRRTDSTPPVAAAIASWSLGRVPAGVSPGAIGAIEDDRWLVMLGGYGMDRPGRTPEGFRRLCRVLPPVFAAAAEEEMLGEIRTYHQATSMRRDYHLLERLPARLVSVGDAVASFNPIYGQGMSSAALHASCLSEYLRSDPDLSAPANDFRALQRIVVDAAWQTSASPDLALPHINGPYPRGYRLAQRVTNMIVDASVTDVEVGRRFTAVAHMRAHPSTLATPGTLLRAARAVWRDQRRTG
jgi:2-polyprenyl-6-methoxyphenol hydroxylase-like FAD-dependent oxidoreductase